MKDPLTGQVEVINQTFLNVAQQSTKIKKTAYCKKEKEQKAQETKKKCSRDKSHTWWQTLEQLQAVVEQSTHS